MVVDLDDSATWPDDVRELCERRADDVRGTAQYLDELGLSVETEDDFRALLAGVKVRAFHATRLLDHEVTGIRENGLRLLTVELVEGRVEEAHRHGAISADEREVFADAHVFAERHSRGRGNQISLFLSRRTLDERPHGLWHQFSEWGGEAIGMSAAGAKLRERLRELGRPAVIVARLELSASWKVHAVHPALQMLFVGRLLDLDRVDGSVHYRWPIPGADIEAIWQPGHAEYDVHRELPRE